MLCKILTRRFLGPLFCMESQLKSEVTDFMRQALAVYKDFGFSDSHSAGPEIGAGERMLRATFVIVHIVLSWLFLPLSGYSVLSAGVRRAVRPLPAPPPKIR